MFLFCLLNVNLFYMPRITSYLAFKIEKTFCFKAAMKKCRKFTFLTWLPLCCVSIELL